MRNGAERLSACQRMISYEGRMSSFTCPQCQSTEVAVVDSRPHPTGIKRRRRCAKCDHKFSTLEKVMVFSTRETKRRQRDEAIPALAAGWADEYDQYRSGGVTVADIAAARSCSAATVYHNFDIVRSARAASRQVAEGRPEGP